MMPYPLRDTGRAACLPRAIIAIAAVAIFCVPRLGVALTENVHGYVNFHRNPATSHGEQSPQLTRGLTRRARLLLGPPGARWLKAFSLAEPEATRKSNPPSLRFSTDAQFFAV
jgi:hypothetical protein